LKKILTLKALLEMQRNKERETMTLAEFNFNYNRAYSAAVEFNTIVDEKFTGREQRRDVWENPRRTWILEMDKNKIDREALVEFFVARKGRKEAFNWLWSAEKGGDGQTHKVRFGADKLELNILELGYANFKIELVEVVD
jgi:hypothetical protein